MKASLKGKYDSSQGKGSATAIVAISAGDVKLRASMTDATITNGTSLSNLAFSVEKPDFFVIDYDVPKKDVSFKFTNTVSVLEKPLNIGYRHKLGDKETTLDGTLVFDSANKLSADYAFGSGNCKLKYSYVHGGTRTFEPCYDLNQNSWDIAVSQKILDNDMFKASYKTSSKVLGLEWSRKSKFNGSFKVSASLNVAEELKMPKLTAESAWDFEI